jgi:hypothetical protein
MRLAITAKNLADGLCAVVPLPGSLEAMVGGNLALTEHARRML